MTVGSVWLCLRSISLSYVTSSVCDAVSREVLTGLARSSVDFGRVSTGQYSTSTLSYLVHGISISQHFTGGSYTKEITHVEEDIGSHEARFLPTLRVEDIEARRAEELVGRKLKVTDRMGHPRRGKGASRLVWQQRAHIL